MNLFTVVAAMVSMAGCTTGETGFHTEYGDSYAASHRDPTGIRTELRANESDVVLASMFLPLDGAAYWQHGDVTRAIVVDAEPVDLATLDPSTLLERADLETAVGHIPADEQEANDLLHLLYVSAAANDPSLDTPYFNYGPVCDVHYYDNMTCVTCVDGDVYCYSCAWEDEWGSHGYTQCAGGGGGNDPYQRAP